MQNFLFSLCFFCAVGVLSAQNCNESNAIAILQGNDVKAAFRAGGDFFWDGQSTPQFQVPYTSTAPTPNTLFAGALWLGTFDAGGNLLVAAQTYRSGGNEYWTGPLNANGQASSVSCSDFDHIWQVARWEVEQHQQDFNDNGIIDGPVPARILAWPGKGNPQFAAQMGFTLPSQDLAPFYDRNGNGTYEPLLGDYPVYNHNDPNAIAEETLWWIFNDNGNLHSQSNGQPLKAEVHATAWSFNCQGDDLVNRTIFLRHSITNKGNLTWHDFKAGLWNDADLGCRLDDYAGTDVPSNTTYWYNADNDDDVVCGTNGTLGYGIDPPVQTVTILNRSLDACMYGANSRNDPLGTPNSPFDYYHLLSGLWTDGTPLSSGGSGYDAAYNGPSVFYAFPDNPNDPNGWSMYSESLASLDTRTLSSVYEDSVPVGATLTVDVAYAFHRNVGDDHLANVNYALQRVGQIQQWYDNGLALTNCMQPAACVQNCVYPGDMNNNGIANDFDLLDWGVGMGQNLTIAPRTVGRDNWFPYDLPTPATSGYLDADGNGVLSDADWDVNDNNLELTHPLYTGAAEGFNTVGNDLFFERWYYRSPFPIGNLAYDTVVHRGDRLAALIHVGQATQPIENLYGLVFEIEYDTTVIESVLPPLANHYPWRRDPSIFTWMGGKMRNRYEKGLIQYVQVRTDGMSTDSSGVLAELELRVRADAPINSSIMTTDICFRNFKAIDSTGAVIPIGAMCTTIEYYDSNYTIQVNTLPTPAYQAKLFPNPTQDQTTLEVALEDAQALTVEIVDLTGRVVYSHPVQELPAGTHQLRLPTTALPAGVYQCRLASDTQQQVLPLVKGR